MNKKWTSHIIAVGAIVVFIVLGLASGASMPAIVYDQSVPIEHSSTLKLLGREITALNGVKPSKKLEGGTTAATTVIIPAGDYKLELFKYDFKSDYVSGGRIEETSQSGRVDMNFTFLQGKTYYVGIQFQGKKIVGIIFDLTDSELIPNPNSPDATPFEGKWLNIKDGKDQAIFAKNEYIFFLFGKYSHRGFFTSDGSNVTLYPLAEYKKGKWEVAYWDKTYPLSYNGTTLKRDDRNIEMKKQ